MANKKKCITVFFNSNDEEIYMKLMSMNKFVRSEFIRIAIRKMFNGDNGLNFDIGIQNQQKTVIPENKKEVIIRELEENTNPFSID